MQLAGVQLGALTGRLYATAYRRARIARPECEWTTQQTMPTIHAASILTMLTMLPAAPWDNQPIDTKAFTMLSMLSMLLLNI